MQTANLRNAKKTLTIVIVVLAIIMFIMPICSAIVKFTPLNNNTQTANPAASGWDLANAEDKGDGVYQIPNDAYKNNSSFVINNLKGLKRFAGVVNGDKRDFKGKTVYLNDNIDCEGGHVTIGFCWKGFNRYFEGDFDGQYHTISNFYSSYYYQKDEMMGLITVERNYYGFFTYASGTIQKLRLKDFSIYADGSSHVGTLVGYGNGVTLQYCAVENAGGDVKYDFKDPLDLSMVASGNTLESCYFDLSKVSATTHIITWNNATNCVIKGAYGVEDDDYSTKNKNTAVKGQWVGLSYNSIGGDSTTYWYSGGEDYNGGWLYPRHFITKIIGWKTVRFVATNGQINGATGGTYDILIPANGGPAACPATSSISIYGRTIGSVTTLCHHGGVQWSYQDATFYVNVGGVDTYTKGYQYRVTYSPKKINIKINIKKDGEVSSGKEYKDVDCGRKISVTNTGDLKKAKSITINDYTYTPDEKYYISNVEAIKKITSYHHNTQSIEITVELKKYDMEIS